MKPTPVYDEMAALVNHLLRSSPFSVLRVQANRIIANEEKLERQIHIFLHSGDPKLDKPKTVQHERDKLLTGMEEIHLFDKATYLQPILEGKYESFKANRPGLARRARMLTKLEKELMFQFPFVSHTQKMAKHPPKSSKVLQYIDRDAQVVELYALLRTLNPTEMDEEAKQARLAAGVQIPFGKTLKRVRIPECIRRYNTPATILNAIDVGVEDEIQTKKLKQSVLVPAQKLADKKQYITTLGDLEPFPMIGELF